MNTLKKFLLLLIPLVFLFLSCQKKPIRTIEKGTWYISLFMDNNKDQTDKYFGYTLEFRDDGSLLATHSSGSAYLGEWGFDYHTNKYWFVIHGTEPLDDLSEDWNVISTSKTLIQLIDDNPSKTKSLDIRKR